jgi:16S rRNA (cytosine1402-N4)-methyltransferase
MMSNYHVPVLLHNAVDGLKPEHGGVFADLTLGGAGHTKLILQRMPKNARLVVFDKDSDALNNAPDDARLIRVHGDFKFLKNHLNYAGCIQVDGILADLGVSSHQFDASERGFSFRADAPLDMRMNKNAGVDAAELLNKLDLNELAKIFRNYGELHNAGAFAKAVIKEREAGKMQTTGHLAALADRLKGKLPLKKYLAMVFQAVRIAVNQEMEGLEKMLGHATEVLKPGGRLVVISYHSLEDRLVKNCMRQTAPEASVHRTNGNPYFIEITRKPVVPSAEEMEKNPRARSAKLRIAERTNEPFRK